jgi:Domain of unknown function (DUF4145)
MYRSALETLLYEQNYKNGMLDAKIKALLADAKPPAWRDQADPEYLEALKQIGNGAVHPGDGNIERQQAIDVRHSGCLGPCSKNCSTASMSALPSRRLGRRSSQASCGRSRSPQRRPEVGARWPDRMVGGWSIAFVPLLV